MAMRGYSPAWGAEPVGGAAPVSSPASPQVQPAHSGVPKAAPSAQAFFIQEYDIEGNTVLKSIDIERAVTPFLGPTKSIRDIEAARQSLEKMYHDHGYKSVLVNIPPQRVSDGTVRLAVTEAPVGRLAVNGSRYHSPDQIRKKMAELNPGVVPDFNKVQAELGNVNGSAELRVTPVFRASDTPGKVDVDLTVTDGLPLHATIETDNRYSANTSHTRMTGEVAYDDLFQDGQSATFQYQIAPSNPSDAEIWSASYVIPLPAHLALALYAVHSNSNVAAVGSVDVIGKGNIYGLRFIAPLPTNDPEFYHSITAGLDYKAFQQSVMLQGATETIESPANYPAFTVQYSATWLGAALSPSGYSAATATGRSDTNLDLGLSFLVQGLGTNSRQFADKRSDASTSYIILHPTVSREQVLPGRLTLAAILDGQVTNGPLINNEQYSAGGADTVRGYVESERLADDGARGTLELRSPELPVPKFMARLFSKVDMFYVFAFVDEARLHIIEPLPGQESTFTLESAGIGFKFKSEGFSLNADGARVFQPGEVTSGGTFRGLFSASYTY